MGNNTASRLAKTAERMKAAQASKGGDRLGPWPDEPNSKEHLCQVKMSINWDAKFSWGKRGSRKEVDAFELAFKYIAEDTPEGDPFEFSGNPFTIPYDIDTLPEGGVAGKQQTRCNIELGRLKGSLAALLECSPDDVDLATAIDETGQGAVQVIFADAEKNNGVVSANVFLEFRDSSYILNGNPVQRTDKKDFIREIV